MGAQRSWACLGVFLGALVTHAGEAQTLPAQSLVWDCAQRYYEPYPVRCTPRQEGGDPNATAWHRRVTPLQRARQVRSPDLRPVAQRGEAEVFAVAAWDVPLHALPLDGVFVVELLRSVLCGRVPACEINYDAPEVRADDSARTSMARRNLP